MSNLLADFAASLRAGKPAFAAFISLSEAQITENLLRDGFDTAILDMQHGLHSTQSVIVAIGAAAAVGKAVFVRPPVGDFAFASRALDAGAAGVIAPMINSAAEARAFASFCKYPPAGERSWGPFRATGLSGLDLKPYLAAANSFSLAIAMIETRPALAALDEILSVPTIDGVFVGPSDLSIALTHGETVDQFHPEVDAALTLVAERARAHGKIASCFAPNGKRAAEMIARGYHISSIGTDQVLLRSATRAELAVARGSTAAAAPAKGY